MSGRDLRVQPPALDAYSGVPLFNTKAAVHQTGVLAPTLRAWERRYGILSPQRGENDYRLYSERDIVTVTWLRERIQSGMTISQAIALLRSLDMGRRRARRAAHTAGNPDHDSNGDARVAMAVADTRVRPALDRFGLAELQKTLVFQLSSFEEEAASHTIAQSLAVYPVEDVCIQLLAPALHEIGRLWAEGTLNVTVEHFATALIRAQLASLFRSAGAAQRDPLVLVGCAPGEQHEIGALMLALFLRRAGFHVAHLGPSIEPNSLVATVQVVRPAAILLSASTEAPAQNLVSLGQQLAGVPGPKPLFGFGGRVFESAPELVSQIAGQYFGTDLQQAVWEARSKWSA